LPIRVEFDVRGIGRWKNELIITMPPLEIILKIANRHNLLHGGIGAGKAML
jgi:hypothetical protein